jgi:hypothetical protein
MRMIVSLGMVCCCHTGLVPSEATLRSAEEDHRARVAGLNEELTRLRSMYEAQQTVYHESVSAATEQVGRGATGWQHMQ